jgi:hypothetical protein
VLCRGTAVSSFTCCSFYDVWFDFFFFSGLAVFVFCFLFSPSSAVVRKLRCVGALFYTVAASGRNDSFLFALLLFFVLILFSACFFSCIAAFQNNISQKKKNRGVKGHTNNNHTRAHIQSSVKHPLLSPRGLHQQHLQTHQRTRYAKKQQQLFFAFMKYLCKTTLVWQSFHFIASFGVGVCVCALRLCLAAFLFRPRSFASLPRFFFSAFECRVANNNPPPFKEKKPLRAK